MKLSQLQYYNVICKYSNITRASEELHVSQPSLSGVINDLENEFGVTLFFRQRNGLKITPEGERLMELSAELTAQADALAAEMKALGKIDNTVKIGIPPMVGYIIFPDIFHLLRVQYPNTKLNITEVGSLNGISQVLDGTLDTALVACNDPLPSTLNQMTICSLRIMYYISIENPLAYMTLLDYDKIKDAPLVLLRENTYINQFVEKAYKKRGYTPNCVLHIDQLYTIRGLLDNNSASTFLYEGVLNPREENIVAIPLPEDSSIQINLIWHKNHQPSTGLNNLIRLIKNNHFGKH